jgi:hypothetical protein
VRRSTRGAAALVVAALAASLSLVVGAVPGFAATGKVPFTDPAQVGLLTLCDKGNHRITSGSITAQPFVWKAVSSAPAPAKYEQGDATLYAYQPIKYEDPAFWSGFQLNGAAYFSNSKHPATASTVQDQPLAAFTTGYPLHWNGLLQIRMIYTSVGRGALHTTYPAAVLRVSGKRWTLVQGGSTPCTASAALSTEPSVLGHKHGKFGLKGYKGGTDTQSSTKPASRVSGRPSPGSSASGSPDPSQSLAASSTNGGSSSSGGGGTDGLAIALVVIALVVVIGSGVALWRRRTAP